MLAEELPDARMIRASSILELRISPERLTNEIVKFVDDCWGGRPSRSAAGGRRSANGSTQAGQARRRPA
jgi:hypothetical protein